MTAINYQNMVSDYKGIVRKLFKDFERARRKQFRSSYKDKRFKREHEMGKKFFSVVNHLRDALIDGKKIMQGDTYLTNIINRVEEGYREFRQIMASMDSELKKEVKNHIGYVEEDYLFYIKNKNKIKDRQKRNEELNRNRSLNSLTHKLWVPDTMTYSEAQQFLLDMARIN